jgi:hypothetical protein
MTVHPAKLGTLVLACLLVAPPFLVAQDEEAVQEVIRRQVEQIRTMGELSIEDAHIASVIVVPELYERGQFSRVWTDQGTISDMFRAIDDSGLDGLNPDDYHRAALLDHRRRIDGGSTDPEVLADYDMLLTDALVRLGYHILFGKVDPEALDPNWNLVGDLGEVNPTDLIQGAIRSGRL